MQEPSDSLALAESPPGANRRLAVLAVAAGIFVFLPSLWNEFVYDDHIFIVQNPWIQSWDNLGAVLASARSNVTSGHEPAFWRPLRNLSYLVDYSIAGLSPFWFHLMNLFWHGLAVLGLFALVRRMGFDGRVAFLTALLFAVHPAQSESVLWAKERDGLMGTALLIWALWAMLGTHWRAVVGSLVLLAAALLSKEHTVVFPALALGVAWVRHRSRASGDPGETQRIGAVILLSLPMILLFLFLRSQIVGKFAQVDELIGGTYGATIWTMFGVFVRYFLLMVAPVHLRLSYSYIEPAAPISPLPILGVFLVAASLWAIWHFRQRQPGVSLGLFWTLVALAPYSNLVPMIQWMAVRFLYLPLAGASLAVAVAVLAVLDRMERQGGRDHGKWRPWQVVGLGIALVLGGLSLNRSFVWHNSATLWTDAYRMTPNTRETQIGYSSLALSAGRPEEALEVLSNYPFYEDARLDDQHAWAAKAAALDALGRRQEALEVIEEGLRVLPPSRTLMARYAWLHAYDGNLPEAEAAWIYILEREPTYAPAWEGLAIVLSAQGREEAGRQALQNAALLKTTPAREWSELDLVVEIPQTNR